MSSRVHFSEDTTTAELELDPEVANRLFHEAGFLVLKDVPRGTEVGIDMQSWNTGDRFLGIKLIPPGLHFVYYCAVNTADRSTAPRTGFFHSFKPRELVAMRWDTTTEMLVDDVSEEEKEGMLSGVKNIDRNLGAYPLQSWSKWVSLSSRLSEGVVQRLSPATGRICAVSDMLPDQIGEAQAEAGMPSLIPRPGTEVRFSQIPRKKYPENATAAEITKHSLDTTHQLDTFMSVLKSQSEVLAELQFAFLCFLVGQNYDCFEQWKLLVSMLCGCRDGLLKYPGLFVDFISDLHFQMQEVPEDFFVDIVSQNNFLVNSLTDLFENIRVVEGVDRKLQKRAANFENYLSKRFGWCFSDDAAEENGPVVVELSEEELTAANLSLACTDS